MPALLCHGPPAPAPGLKQPGRNRNSDPFAIAVDLQANTAVLLIVYAIRCCIARVAMDAGDHRTGCYHLRLCYYN